MRKTLILMFHPDPARSRANAALAAAARGRREVELIDMQARHPDGCVDVAAEAALLRGAGRLVLQFPLRWYATPAPMKAWMDAVLTHLFYLHPEEGRMLEGVKLLVAATAGNVQAAYAPDGANLFPMESLLAPLRATAHRCGMPWTAPFVVYGANRLDASGLEAAGAAYVARLRELAA
ncbi:NAD(P)H-dependent oxidoreductase [Falsiroseomonas sp.]|uniref:NAD(P)H-dependent oxidoreductase n=1 Tax=Falsiroseomonas sp. TaxID=2870721 RepID=UPI00271F59EA|nr:NAD(P)H-dependent oxidoreductase [Falsiroseomonas sp.]MDO9500578.1 NAD(P)H-dependent oxidoreductase [Falsiroseomonas sp.]